MPDPADDSCSADGSAASPYPEADIIEVKFTYGAGERLRISTRCVADSVEDGPVILYFAVDTDSDAQVVRRDGHIDFYASNFDYLIYLHPQYYQDLSAATLLGLSADGSETLKDDVRLLLLIDTDAGTSTGTPAIGIDANVGLFCEWDSTEPRRSLGIVCGTVGKRDKKHVYDYVGPVTVTLP